MIVAVPNEASSNEPRVAATPETVRQYARQGLSVQVEPGAGAAAHFADEAFAAAGASLTSCAAMLPAADIIIRVGPPPRQPDDFGGIKPGAVLVCTFAAQQPLLAADLARRNITAFSLELMPRITRAQSMDVLSSQNTVAGYKAVLLAADAIGRLMPMMMTAAGTVPPARALVIGAGVAGLQAIATARRLGAQVKGVDTRPAAGEQVQSLGARFVELKVAHEQAQTSGGYARDLGEDFYRQEQEILAPHVAEADLIVTTALVPGRAAPKLITETMVAAMKGGSAIVDMAAPAGGNCTLSRPDQRVTAHGVTILAPTNLAAAMPYQASQMYARNVAAFLGELVKDGRIGIDLSNEVLAGTLLTHEGKVVHEPTRQAIKEAAP
jgi:NAD(P) transhydrogenase subunit alpha